MKQYRNDRGHELLAWVRRHPIASLFGLWVVLMAMAGLSTAALVSIEPEEAPEAETTIAALPEDQPVALVEHSNIQTRETLPLVSFGAIAVSCTLGCLALSQVVRPVARPHKLRSEGRFPFREALPTGEGDSRSGRRCQGAEAAETSSTVVVPTEHDHPLDWDEPSLADSLDLRQRRPLSHWL
jgi:hypothetical protein